MRPNDRDPGAAGMSHMGIRERILARAAVPGASSGVQFHAARDFVLHPLPDGSLEFDEARR